MPIANIDKVKTLTGIAYTDDTYNEQLSELIPVLQDWLCDYLNNYFHVNTTMAATSISFVDGFPATIVDSESQFSEEDGFVEAMDIHVEGSLGNDGIYQVVGLADGTLTLADNEVLEDEDEGEMVLITRVKFPRSLQRPFAQLVKFDLANKNPDITSFRLGDYSENYAGKGNYPPGLLKKFSPWKQMRSRRK